MDVLTSKQIRAYDNLSRYQDTPFYYHSVDQKYIMGLGKHLKTTTSYTEHLIVMGDTFDSLALKYYNAPTYYWVIADFNRVADPFVKLPVGLTIKIPTLTAIEFEEEL